MGRVIAVANEKGGVGKTTISAQLAFELASRGLKTLVIDNDPSGDVTTALCGANIPFQISVSEAESNTMRLYSGQDVKPLQVRSNLYLIGASDVLSLLKGADMEPAFNFCDSLSPLSDEFDFIIIDCPPSFGLLFTAAVLSSGSGGVVVPVIPDELSFKAAKKISHRIAQMNSTLKTSLKLIGVIPNKVINPMPQSVKHYMEHFKDEFKSGMFNAYINQAIKISDALTFQEKVSDYSNPSSKAATQIAAVTDEILLRLGDNT